jgi:hypothetical protein
LSARGYWGANLPRAVRKNKRGYRPELDFEFIWMWAGRDHNRQSARARRARLPAQWCLDRVLKPGGCWPGANRSCSYWRSGWRRFILTSGANLTFESCLPRAGGCKCRNRTTSRMLKNRCCPWFDRLTMRAKPLKTRDLILSLSKDEEDFMLFQQPASLGGHPLNPNKRIGNFCQFLACSHCVKIPMESMAS